MRQSEVPDDCVIDHYRSLLAQLAMTQSSFWRDLASLNPDKNLIAAGTEAVGSSPAVLAFLLYFTLFYSPCCMRNPLKLTQINSRQQSPL